ncbi:hypothetical protein [Streptantibioticus silvisoli]|jgi:hypothetical protein|uniref:Transcriptional regulator n=1 Tax=Streptantibioticus silvisoli TaxID=2705255 RepID=A0ABT6VXX4_9ACTN|nr:hypothetical protein [Streptantibioticus silvisoli]MDI5962106.1 hypothetical protein [Streptantibioticus silvisoli]
MSDIPPPPCADQNAALIRRRLRDAAAGGGTPETVTVEWNQKPVHVNVIDLPLRDLYYNPATHRIQAQRDHRAGLAQRLKEDPWADDSQQYLHHLLMGNPASPDEPDPEFADLKASLGSVSQQEPGLVTYAGILVNGNTRAAALRELKQTSIRVGVLPESFTWEDVAAVELALQLRPDKRREYSYINRLLAMEEQASLGRAAEAIARDFHMQEKTFHQERWILGVIRDMIERSKTVDGVQLRLVDFEGHQENLKELHRTYRNADSSDKAEQIKENRIVAILLDFAKTRTRLVDDKFQEKYLVPAVSAVQTIAAPVPAISGNIPGLTIAPPPEPQTLARARAFTDLVLKAKAVENAAGLPETAIGAARDQVTELRKGLRRALDAAERDDRLRKSQQTAAEHLDDACAAINQTISDLAKARSTQSLDEDSFDDAVLRLRASLARLAQQASRGLAEPGDGVAWLRSMAGGTSR